MNYCLGFGLSILSFFWGPELVKKTENSSKAYVTEVGKQYQFYDALVARNSLNKYAWSPLSLNFIGHQNISLSEVQPLAHTIFKNYVLTLKKDLGSEFAEVEFLKSSCLRFSFWDEKWDRKLPPYIAEVHVYGGKIRYYQSNPETQELVLILEEPCQQDVIDLCPQVVPG